MTDTDIKADLLRIEGLLNRQLNALAEEQIYRLRESHPKHPKVLALMYRILIANGDEILAGNISLKALEEQPENLDWMKRAAMALIRARGDEQALEFGRQVLERQPNNPGACLDLAQCYERVGKLEASEEVLDRIPQEHQDQYNAPILMIRAEISSQRKDYESVLRHAEEAIQSAQDQSDLPISMNRDEFIRDIWFWKAKALDRIGDYDGAWSAATNAHKIIPPPEVHDSPYFKKNYDSLIGLFSKIDFSALSHATEFTESEPLFIVGQPRSGTSLLEQIFSMHPDISNGGEMSATANIQRKLKFVTDSYLSWPESLIDMRVEDANTLAQMYFEAERDYQPSEPKKVMTNKALNLPAVLGLFALILPKSRSIMLKRHPLDNCVSCYLSNLLTSGHTYCADLTSLAQTWITRRKLQDFWTETIDTPVMTLQYESLVTNQEHETKRLIKFLDLPWEEQCLRFHKSNYVARTLSYDQVNQKMYTTSSGRWKNYEKHLGPLIDALDEYL